MAATGCSAMPKQYDVIVSDPSDIWVAGTGSLTTLEYYRIVAARLKPGGIFAQWVHTHALLPDDLGLLAATFHAVFPHMEIWTSAPGNLIFLGTRDSVPWDYARSRSDSSSIPRRRGRLAGGRRLAALCAVRRAGPRRKRKRCCSCATSTEFHTDDHPVLEFRTPRSLYVDTTPMIAQELSDSRRPDAPAIAGFDPTARSGRPGRLSAGIRLRDPWASRTRPSPTWSAARRWRRKSPVLGGLGESVSRGWPRPDARTAYERALTLDINNVEALVSLGEIRLDEGQLKWTRVLAERALRARAAGCASARSSREARRSGTLKNALP